MASPLLERLGAWVGGLHLRDVPDDVRHAAARSIVDTVGVAIAAVGRPVPAAATRLAVAQYAVGASALIGDDRRLVPAGAAFVNAATAHTLDFDDTCYVGIAHGSAVVLPAALAVAQGLGTTGDALLAAFIAGVEAEYTFGRLFGDHLYFKGFWNTGVLGTIGAAAAAARARGLTADQTAHALAIAACHVIGLRACLGTMAKPILAGRSAEAGVTAAMLAADGVDGPRSVLEGDNGWAKVLNDGRIDPTAMDRLGAPFVLTDPGVAFKLYPACSAVQAAVETVQELLSEQGAGGGDVERVLCEVTPLVHISLRYPRPRTTAEAQFSMPFAVGCALVHGSFGPAMLTDAHLLDPALAEAMARVEMVLAADLADDPRTMTDCPEGARVTVILKDGRRTTRFNPLATGMPGKPMPDAMLSDKALRMMEPVVGASAARTLLDRLWSLERLEEVASLLPSRVDRG